MCVSEREIAWEGEGEVGGIMDRIKTGCLMLNFTVTLTTLTSILLV